MLKESLLEIFERDLRKLKNEIELYKNDESLWVVSGEIGNSGGNLALHLIGNLNHFVGAILGNTGFIRDRDAEFSSNNDSRAEICENIEKTISMVLEAIGALSEQDFDKEFPAEKHGTTHTIDFMLLHLMTHFNYHLGQINYHRRMS